MAGNGQVDTTEGIAQGSVAPDANLTNTLLGAANGIVAFAQNRVGVVDKFVGDLSAQVLTLVAPTITPAFPTVFAAPQVTTVGSPEITDPVWTAPGIPAPFLEVLDTGDLDVQPFDTQPPTLVYGTAPAAFAGSLPDAPSVDLQFTYPTLSVTLPAPPVLLTINTIPWSGVTFPMLTAQPPDTVLLIPPQITPFVEGDGYTSSLLTSLQGYLQGVIANGTDGLSRPGEEAIWARGLEKEAYSNADAIQQLDKMEALGFAFAPGIWLDARLKILTEASAQQRGYAREVTATSAQMNLDQIKTALEQATQLESRLIDYNNQVEQRLFESSRYITEAGVSIYNAKVQAFTAMTQVYATKIEAYKAQVQAATAEIEAYRAQIDAERAKAETNTATVDAYKAEIEAAMTNVEIWKAELSGIELKANIEKTKVELFGEFVQAYAGQVNAYSAGVEAYKATLQAQEVKQQVFTSQVAAYSAIVDAQTKVASLRIENYKAQIDAKSLEYDGYKAGIAGASALVDAGVRTQALNVDLYRAELSATQTYNELLTKQWQVALDQSERVAQIGVSAAEAQGQLYVSTRGLALEAVKSSASVSAQIAAAGINAVNYSGSVSSSESYGQSLSVSGSTQNSVSKSTSYIYNESV